MPGYLKWSCSRSCFTQDQRTKQQWQVDNRGYKQPSRIRPRARFQKSHRYGDKHGTEDQLRQKIKNRGYPKKRRQTGNDKKEHAEEDTLAGAPFTSAIITRDHLETGAGIIVAIHPRDRGEGSAERIADEGEIGHAEDRQCATENDSVPRPHSPR